MSRPVTFELAWFGLGLAGSEKLAPDSSAPPAQVAWRSRPQACQEPANSRASAFLARRTNRQGNRLQVGMTPEPSNQTYLVIRTRRERKSNLNRVWRLVWMRPSFSGVAAHPRCYPPPLGRLQLCAWSSEPRLHAANTFRCLAMDAHCPGSYCAALH